MGLYTTSQIQPPNAPKVQNGLGKKVNSWARTGVAECNSHQRHLDFLELGSLHKERNVVDGNAATENHNEFRADSTGREICSLVEVGMCCLQNLAHFARDIVFGPPHIARVCATHGVKL